MVCCVVKLIFILLFLIPIRSIFISMLLGERNLLGNLSKLHAIFFPINGSIEAKCRLKLIDNYSKRFRETTVEQKLSNKGLISEFLQYKYFQEASRLVVALLSKFHRLANMYRRKQKFQSPIHALRLTERFLFETLFDEMHLTVHKYFRRFFIAENRENRKFSEQLNF